jgi:hypothetical protein
MDGLIGEMGEGPILQMANWQMAHKAGAIVFDMAKGRNGKHEEIGWRVFGGGRRIGA